MDAFEIVEQEIDSLSLPPHQHDAMIRATRRMLQGRDAVRAAHTAFRAAHTESEAEGPPSWTVDVLADPRPAEILAERALDESSLQIAILKERYSAFHDLAHAILGNSGASAFECRLLERGISLNDYPKA